MMSMILGDRVGTCDLIEIGFDDILELLGVRNLTMFRRQLLPHLLEAPAFPHVADLAVPPSHVWHGALWQVYVSPI